MFSKLNAQFTFYPQTAKMTSDKWYKADYKRDCVGKSGPADIINYPQLQQARIAAGNASNVNFFLNNDHVVLFFKKASIEERNIRLASMSTYTQILLCSLRYFEMILRLH